MWRRSEVCCVRWSRWDVEGSVFYPCACGWDNQKGFLIVWYRFSTAVKRLLGKVKGKGTTGKRTLKILSSLRTCMVLIFLVGAKGWLTHSIVEVSSANCELWKKSATNVFAKNGLIMPNLKIRKRPSDSRQRGSNGRETLHNKHRIHVKWFSLSMLFHSKWSLNRAKVGNEPRQSWKCGKVLFSEPFAMKSEI